MTYRHRDRNGQQVEITPSIHLHDGKPSIAFFIPLAEPGRAGRVHVPLDRIEELVAGIREAARQAARRAP
ncbi:hypothetical protein [Streptomyces sp. NPDC057336]|uniref:hypothetical protein n=1 Tax=Streptomyces sp. NPDC057336 TaxID=3346102 RepID=UPI003634C72B